MLSFHEIDKSHLLEVGGKGANLGEMTQAGFPVPPGFCVTTWAFRTFVQTSTEIDELIDLLDGVRYDDLEHIGKLGQQIRDNLTSIPMPEDIQAAISHAWESTGQERAYAVRSSATAEDLPTASFAGQQDTYLNICGLEQLLQAVQKCWASLFTDRAISYRAKNGFNHRAVYLSVVVQQMVFPDVSGILFTADPITGHRNTLSIDASFGLGEALVSGLVTADLYQVLSDEIIKKQISKKEIAIDSLPEGGTITRNLPPEKQEVQALPDDKILELARWGQKIEAHYGSEQDIEWGFADGTFYILQSRPITSLYPVPSVSDDKLHVFINFGHIQMMTDPMKPLAISVLNYVPNFLKKDPVSSDHPFIREAGGRAFADLTGLLSLQPVRNRVLKIMTGMDERMASALAEVVKRDEFRHAHVPKKEVLRIVRRMAPILIPTASRVAGNWFFKNPRNANQKATALIEQLVKDTEGNLSRVSGVDRIRMIRQDMASLLPRVLSKIIVYLLTGVLASGMLEKKLKQRIGAERSSSLLSRLYKSLPGNVTTEVGLELGDLADAIREYPEVIAYLQGANKDSFYEDLIKLPGGTEFAGELDSFLQKYGMRCVGEIDITNPRWREDPTQLVPSIISNLQTASAGEHRRKFKQGEIEAE